MDVVIETPTEHSTDFKRSLHRFLDTNTFAVDEGFTIHWAEPRGDSVLQHLSFATAAVAEAFQRLWRQEGAAQA